MEAAFANGSAAGIEASIEAETSFEDPPRKRLAMEPKTVAKARPPSALVNGNSMDDLGLDDLGLDDLGSTADLSMSSTAHAAMPTGDDLQREVDRLVGEVQRLVRAPLPAPILTRLWKLALEDQQDVLLLALAEEDLAAAEGQKMAPAKLWDFFQEELQRRAPMSPAVASSGPRPPPGGPVPRPPGGKGAKTAPSMSSMTGKGGKLATAKAQIGKGKASVAKAPPGGPPGKAPLPKDAPPQRVMGLAARKGAGKAPSGLGPMLGKGAGKAAGMLQQPGAARERSRSRSLSL